MNIVCKRIIKISGKNIFEFSSKKRAVWMFITATKSVPLWHALRFNFVYLFLIFTSVATPVTVLTSITTFISVLSRYKSSSRSNVKK